MLLFSFNLLLFSFSLLLFSFSLLLFSFSLLLFSFSLLLFSFSLLLFSFSMLLFSFSLLLFSFSMKNGIDCVATTSTENVQTILLFMCVLLFFFLSYHVSMKWSFLTRDRIFFCGFICLSDPFWSQACCASHHIFAANATMPQIRGTSCFVALFFFISYFDFSCLIIPYLLFYVRCCNHASFF